LAGSGQAVKKRPKQGRRADAEREPPRGSQRITIKGNAKGDRKKRFQKKRKERIEALGGGTSFALRERGAVYFDWGPYQGERANETTRKGETQGT